MVRSIWKGTLVTALSWAGLAWAEPKLAPVPAAAQCDGPTMMICEPGKPQQKCVILKTYRMADGSQAYQVRSLETGEVMTIVEGKGRLGGLFKGRSGEEAPTVTEKVIVKEPAMPAQKPSRGLLSRLFHHDTEEMATSKEVIVTATPKEKPMVVNAQMTSGAKSAKAEMVVSSAAQPGDWRQSWGKADDHKSAKSDLPQVNGRRPDPLKNPEKFALTALDRQTGEVTMAPAEFTPGTSGSIPFGAQSVMAAGDVLYVPVPVMTVPEGVQPQPPMAQPPRPPQPVRPPQGPPNGAMANAFTVIEPDDPDARGMPAPDLVDANAFSPKPTPAHLRSNGFTNVRPPDPDYPAFGTGGGYSMPQGQLMYPARYPMSQGQPMYPAGYPVQMAPMAVPSPYGPSSGTAPAAATGVVPANYAQPASETPTLLATLREALYPSQREWAADKLAERETKTNVLVVNALMTAAKSDPAAMVRVACVRCLCKMNVHSAETTGMLQSLRTDADPRVRHAVEQALGNPAK